MKIIFVYYCFTKTEVVPILFMNEIVWLFTNIIANVSVKEPIGLMSKQGEVVNAV
jgi:hypothetical protein